MSTPYHRLPLSAKKFEFAKALFLASDSALQDMTRAKVLAQWKIPMLEKELRKRRLKNI